LKDPHVLFAGYRMPHPLEHCVVLKVQTMKSGRTGEHESGRTREIYESSPSKALRDTINERITELTLLRERFKVEKDLSLILYSFLVFIF
jgi:DNA-directed RNA polymerase II subunit RPB11